MHILTIFTGGTIGCAPPDDRGVMRPATAMGGAAPEEKYYLLKLYRHAHPNSVVTFETAEPLSTLSEDMTPAKWSVLLNALKTVDFKRYDGIIITHGTDTLAYTAALLGLALAGISTPVVLVSAARNLYHPESNGLQNFTAALAVIAATSHGVYAAFGYEPGRAYVYQGIKMLTSQAFSDRFASLDGEDFGWVENGVFTQAAVLSPQTAREPLLYTLPDCLAPGVQIIEPYPGLDYSSLHLNPAKTRAVLHGVYHSFTVCAEDGFSAIEFAQSCRERGILPVFAPFAQWLLEGGVRYSSTDALLASGALLVPDCTRELAYAALVLAANLCGTMQESEHWLVREFGWTSN